MAVPTIKGNHSCHEAVLALQPYICLNILVSRFNESSERRVTYNETHKALIQGFFL